MEKYLKVKPFEHQIRAFNLSEEHKNFSLFMDMGTGKTLTSIGILGKKIEDEEIKRILIICPKSLVFNWEKEFEKFANFEFVTKLLEKDTSFVKKDVVQIHIINYDRTWRLENELIKNKYEIVLCDESQRIKNHAAKSSKTIHKLARIAKHRYILTGTPLQNNLVDFYSQYKFLDSNIFGQSFYAFRNRYCVMGGYGSHQIVSYKNLDELKEKIHQVAFRITKEEALTLPKITDNNIFFELEPKCRKIYEQMKKDMIAGVGEGEICASNILTKILRLSQISSGFVPDEEGNIVQISDTKIDLLMDLIEDFDKVVIFVRFIHEIELIKQKLEKSKIGYNSIYGAIKDRQKEVDEFQSDKNKKVFIAQIQTAGVGITLTAASKAVFYSLDYNYANFEQAKARIHRIGQERECDYYYMIAKNTIDEHIIKALDKKEDFAKQIVDVVKKGGTLF